MLYLLTLCSIMLVASLAISFASLVLLSRTNRAIGRVEEHLYKPKCALNIESLDHAIGHIVDVAWKGVAPAIKDIEMRHVRGVFLCLFAGYLPEIGLPINAVSDGGRRLKKQLHDLDSFVRLHTAEDQMRRHCYSRKEG